MIKKLHQAYITNKNISKAVQKFRFRQVICHLIMSNKKTNREQKTRVKELTMNNNFCKIWKEKWTVIQRFSRQPRLTR